MWTKDKKNHHWSVAKEYRRNINYYIYKKLRNWKSTKSDSYFTCLPWILLTRKYSPMFYFCPFPLHCHWVNLKPSKIFFSMFFCFVLTETLHCLSEYKTGEIVSGCKRVKITYRVKTSLYTVILRVACIL